MLKNVLDHIRNNAKEKDIYVDFINGHREHIHCLISLGSGQTIDKTAMLLKGESSFWINKNNLTTKKFSWQEEYFAISVSESMVGTVRAYIKNQKQHHKTKTFQEEYDEFINKFGFDRLKSDSESEL